MKFGWFQTAYNRPEYQQQVSLSWSRARKFDTLKRKAVFLEPSAVQADMVHKIQLMGDVEIINNPTKLGVLVNPWTGFNEMFNRGCEFVIIAEDDVLVSDDVLEYFYHFAHMYRRVSDVSVVCAFSKIGQPYPNGAYISKCFASPLVWGMWKRSWDEFIGETWDKDYSNRGWDWNLDRLMQEKHKFSVLPAESRSTHIGLHGGTHFQAHMAEEAYGARFQEHRPTVEYVLGGKYVK